MTHEYLIDHATGNVTSSTSVHGKIRLLAFNSEAALYTFHYAGRMRFGGQGRPQLYCPAETCVYKALSVEAVGNNKDRIRVEKPLMAWGKR